jgi:hypothetical protein
MARSDRSRIPASRRLAVAPAVALALLFAAAPARADETIATVAAPGPVSAYGGMTAWSALDPATGRYRLTVSGPDGIRTLPIRSRKVPFDVDLGRDARGGVVAAYSRCSREPRRQTLGNALIAHPDWRSGSGCRLWRYSFASGRETRIGHTAARGASEFLPTLWEGRVAFARRYPARAGLSGQRAYLYVRDGDRTRPLPPGARSAYRVCIGGNCHRQRLVVEPGPTAMDLHGSRLALAWDSGSRTGPTSSVYVETIGRRTVERRRLQAVESGDIQGIELVSPVIDGSSVLWGSLWFGDETRSELRRRPLPTGPLAVATIPPDGAYLRPVLAFAVEAGRVTYLVSGGPSVAEPGCTPAAPCVTDPGCSAGRPCEIRVSQGLEFRRP